MKRIIKTILACLVIGLAFGCFLYMVYDPHWQRIATSVLSALFIGSLMMACIYQRRYLLWITPYQSLKMLILILALCLAALIGTELTLLSQIVLNRQHYILFAGGNTYGLNILIVLVTGIPIYVSEEAKENLNTQVLMQQNLLLQLEKQQKEAELELLRAKVNPHFLYNVHNTIAGLISTDPHKAETMILLLSKFFRFSLNKTSTDLHLVKDELDIARTYLQLQQIRYESRLNYEIHITPGIESKQIPSFILQPLVENAVKHGTEPSALPGFIKINISREGNLMVLTVADSGPAFPDVPITGYGLTIVLDKLKLLYGNNYSLELINQPDKYVRLTFPQFS